MQRKDTDTETQTDDDGGTTTNEVTSHRVEEIARSLQEHEGRTDQIARAAARLATSGASQSIASATASLALDGIATSLDETAAATEELARSQAAVATNTRETLEALDI